MDVSRTDGVSTTPRSRAGSAPGAMNMNAALSMAFASSLLVRDVYGPLLRGQGRLAQGLRHRRMAVDSVRQLVQCSLQSDSQRSLLYELRRAGRQDVYAQDLSELRPGQDLYEPARAAGDQAPAVRARRETADD